MILEQEGWEVYYQSAVDIVNNEEMILEQFIEALRILRLRFHKDAIRNDSQKRRLCSRYIRSGNYIVLNRTQRVFSITLNIGEINNLFKFILCFG